MFFCGISVLYVRCCIDLTGGPKSGSSKAESVYDGLMAGMADAKLSLTRRGSWNRWFPPLYLCVSHCFGRSGTTICPVRVVCEGVCLREDRPDKRVIECSRVPGVSEWTTGTGGNTHTHTHTVSCVLATLNTKPNHHQMTWTLFDYKRTGEVMESGERGLIWLHCSVSSVEKWLN